MGDVARDGQLLGRRLLILVRGCVRRVKNGPQQSLLAGSTCGPHAVRRRGPVSVSMCGPFLHGGPVPYADASPASSSPFSLTHKPLSSNSRGNSI